MLLSERAETREVLSVVCSPCLLTPMVARTRKMWLTTFLDAGHDFGDRFGIGKRLVDRFAEFFHELFQLLIHESPWNRTPLMGDITFAL